MWRLIGSVAAVMAFSAAIAGALWKAHDIGKQAGIAESAAVLAAWKQSVVEQANERRKAQQERLDALQGELDELRSRPEKVRTVTRTIRLKPDAECGSLSPDFKRLWDAGYESGLRVGSSAATARVGDAGRVALADAARVIEEAKYRFEQNAARLTGAQQYIERVCRRSAD